MSKNLLALAISLSLSLGITACDSDGSSSPAADTANNINIGGAASKGIVKSGVVTAEELDTAGDAIATVGSAMTNDDGTYELMLENNYAGGPIRITITADENTETKCDVPNGCGTRTDDVADSDSNIDFGEFYKPAALTMTALLPDAEPNETISASVTPFTHMAAGRALASGTVDATSVANANSEVSNLLGGIDILNTAPIDITNLSGDPSANQITYAALASSLANQGLADANGQPDLNAALQLLADSFSNGTIQADDNGDGGDALQISLQEIVSAANETFDAAGIVDTTGKLGSLQSIIDFAESGDGIIDPKPSDTAASEDLIKVKELISSVRTWGNVIDQELDSPSQAFADQVDLAADALDVFGTNDLFDAVGAAVEAAFEYDGRTNLADYTELDINTFASGTIGSPTAGTITITNGVVHNHTVNMTILLPPDGSNSDTFSIGIDSGTVVSNIGHNSLTVDAGTATVVFDSAYTIDYDAIDIGTEVTPPDANDLTFDLDTSFTQNVDGTGAALASPVTFTGAMAFDLDVIDVQDSPGETEVLPRNFTLSGLFSNTAGNQIDASIAGNITNTATFEYFEQLGELDGENGWVDADIGLTFNLQLTGLPLATINITADRTGFDGGNGNVTISYGDRQLIISASSDDISAETGTGTITITNQDSAIFNLTLNSTISGNVTLKGVEHATVTETDSGFIKITYTDGTFEIF